MDLFKKYIKIVLVNLLIFQILPERFSDLSFMLAVSICIILYTIIKYGFKNYKYNKKLIWKVLILSLLTPLIVNYKLIYCDSLLFINSYKNSIKKLILILGVPLIVFISAYLIYYIFIKRKVGGITKESKDGEELEELPVLIRERGRDLERLKELLADDNLNIIGLNGNFGTGKSLIIEHLKRDLEDEYYTIEIDVLSSNSEDIQITLMNEIDKLLRDNGIFSRYSPKLRSFFSGNNILRNIELGFFYDDTVFINMIKGIKDEVYSLDRPLLIIYEDLDRINNFEVIQKILGISEKLSSKNIKIIYQYSKYNLEKILENELGNRSLSNNYLEKYIHQNLNLTHIELEEMIRFQLSINERYQKYIKKEFLIDIFSPSKKIEIKGYIGCIKIGFKAHLINMRRVERFLNSTYLYLEANKDDHELDILVRTAFIFYLIEYFIPDKYSDIFINKDLEDIFNFKYEDKEYSLSQLYNLDEDKIARIFEDDYNILSIWVLELLGYGLSNVFGSEEVDQDQINKNRKIERRFKNIYSPGISKYTEDEKYAIKLIEDVLSQDQALWDSRYRAFEEAIRVDNEFNIFYIGDSQVVSIFKSFNMIKAGQEDWIRLLKFLKQNKRLRYADKEMFEAFSYIDLDNININIEVGKIISEAEILGNLNDDKYFELFLKRYYRNWLGFGDLDMILAYPELDLNDEEEKKEVIKILKSNIVEFERIKTGKLVKILGNEMNMEIDIDISVTKKLIEIIEREEKFVEKGLNVEMKVDDSEEIKRLRALKEYGDLEEFKSKAREYYFENRISKGQLKYLNKE